jgi:predicted small secreted protein
MGRGKDRCGLTAVSRNPGADNMMFRIAAFSALLASLALGGCGTSSGIGVDQAEEAALAAEAADAPVAPSGIIAGMAQPDSPNCPVVEIFEGGAAMRGRGAGKGATGVGFQASIGDVARECRFNGTTMTMRIGVRGRVVLGTSGSAGSYTVPIRVAVKQGPTVLYSNVARVTVSVPDGNGGAPFQHVEENVVVPQAPDGVDAYEIFVGVDPTGTVTRPAKKRKR